MAGYNGAWTGQQIDEAVRQVTNKDLPADGVKFSDGQTFQQKYDAGQLTGPAGQDGKDGAQGEPGTPGRDGATGPAGRGITGVSYSSSTNKWTISYSDGSSEQITGPAIPTQLSELTGDASHRTVTDEEKTKWNEKADTSYVDEKIDEATGGLTTLYGTVFVSDQYGTRLIPINCENADGTFKAEFELRNNVLYLKNDLTILLAAPGNAVQAYSFTIRLDDGGSHAFLLGSYSSYVATLLLHESIGSYNTIAESRISFSAPTTTDGVFRFYGATESGYVKGYKLIMLRGFWGVLTY